MNIFSISGRLTRDPERNGPATKFTVAVDGYNPSTKQREAEFFPVVAFGKLGDVVMQYAPKGREVVVSGRCHESKWEDSSTGQKRSRWEFIANEVDLVGGRGNGGNQNQNAVQPPSHRDAGDDGGFSLGGGD